MKTIKLAIILIFSITFLISCSKKEKNIETKSQISTTIKTPITSSYSYTSIVVKKNVTWSLDNQKWQQLNTNIVLKNGSYVETGEGSLLVLEGSLGDKVVLGERCKIELSINNLSEYSNKESGTIRGVRILRGIAFFDIKKLMGKFFVETPSALVEVKGTKFTVEYNKINGTTDVNVVDGEVEVVTNQKDKSKRINYTLKKGEKVSGVKNNVKVFKNKILENELNNKFLEPVIFPNKEESKKTKKKLQKNISKMHGAATNAKKIQVEKELIKEKQQVKKEMDSVKTKYVEDKKEIKEDFSKHKEKSRQRIDSTKIASKKVLEKERNKFNTKTQNKRNSLDSERGKFDREKSKLENSRSRNSDESFDELKRRKNRK